MKWASHLLPGNPQRHLDTGKHFSLVPTGPGTEANARPLTAVYGFPSYLARYLCCELGALHNITRLILETTRE